MASVSIDIFLRIRKTPSSEQEIAVNIKTISDEVIFYDLLCLIFEPILQIMLEVLGQ